MLSMKRGLTAVLVTTLVVSQAQANDVLPPGKPAGVREAARRSPNILVMGGAALVAVAGIAIAMDHSSNPACGSVCDVATTTTTS